LDEHDGAFYLETKHLGVDNYMILNYAKDGEILHVNKLFAEEKEVENPR